MKALIVEDDANNVDLLHVRLKNLGCQAIVAIDGEAALQLAADERPDFILLDLKLGNDMMGGAELLMQFKAMPAIAGVPIVIHSVFVNYSNDIPRATSQADYFLPKPFRFQELRRIVDEIRAAQAASQGG